MAIELFEACRVLKLGALPIDVSQQVTPGIEPRKLKAYVQQQARRLKSRSPRHIRPFLMIKLVFGVGAVTQRTVRRSLDEPGVAARSQDARKLSGNHAPRKVHQLFGKHDG